MKPLRTFDELCQLSGNDTITLNECDPRRVISVIPSKNKITLCSKCVKSQETFTEVIHWIHSSFYLKHQGRLIPLHVEVDWPVLRGSPLGGGPG